MLDTIRMGRDVTQIAQEVLQHLTNLLGAEVEIILEIHAKMPDGVSEQVVRTVNENCRHYISSNLTLRSCKR